jgi:heptosyltransferase-2
MNVLIRAPNWIGDAVMATPALRELRRIFGNAHITLATSQAAAGLFDDEGIADDVLALTPGSGRRAAAAFFKNARRLRRRRFDLAILLQNAFSAALLARAGGARRVAGYPTDGRRLLLHRRISFEEGHQSLHQVRYYLNIAGQVESDLTGVSRVTIGDAQPRLSASDRLREVAQTILRNAGAEPSSRIVALNPGATNSRAKRWPPERFAETADRLTTDRGFQTVVVGSAGDLEVANRVAAMMRTPAFVLAGQTTIAELKGLLACTSLVISNDTGGAHVAAALGVPTVVVFGPTEHVSTRPLSNLAEVVRHPVECSPCMLRDCPIDHRCMIRVEVQDVLEASMQLLERAAALQAE